MIRKFRLGLAALTILGSLAGGLATSTPTYATSSLTCAQNDTYGSMCQKVFGTGLKITDIAAYYTESSNLLSGKTWRFTTTFYNCDPRGRSKSVCPPAKTIFGTIRSGSPTPNMNLCTSAGITFSVASLAYSQCADFGVQQVNASNGDLGFVPPLTLSAAQWVCNEIQIKNLITGLFADNGAGTPAGVRACNKVF